MAGKLDEISVVIGELRQGVKNIERSIADNRRVADKRHDENKLRLESIGGRVGDVEEALSSIRKTVAAMQPIVASIAVTRWKLAGAFGLAVSLVTFLGWIVSLFAGHLLAWLLHPMK